VLEDLDHCPADREEVAEAYAMGTLDAAETAAFEDHYITCNSCALAVQEAAGCVGGMRDAARGLRAGKLRSSCGSGGVS
jgi:hypothetical protein